MGDFHGRLASDISAALNRRLRPRYVARLVPRYAVTYESIELAHNIGIRPDVGVWRPPKTLRETATAITPPLVESAIEYEAPGESL